jgi:hypothetical protein
VAGARSSTHHRQAPLAKDIDELEFEGLPSNEQLVEDFAGRRFRSVWAVRKELD